jgi:Na+-driven multidrug efflux pump
MSNGEKPLEPPVLWYILSFIIPILGIILGAIYLGKPEPENKKFGKNCITAAVISIVLVICCVILYFVFIVGVFGMSIFGAAMST